MVQVKLLIRWISIAGIALFLLITVTINVMSVEFKNAEMLSGFEHARSFGMPCLTMLVLLSTIQASDTHRLILTKAARAFLLTACMLFVMVITVFAGKCQWTEGKTLHVNKFDERKKIMVRNVRCGVRRSSPFHATVIVTDLGPWFRTVSAVDTTSIETSLWIRADRMEQHPGPR